MTTNAPPLSPKERYRLTVTGGETDRPPIWIMRQAGRYLPEYMALRSRHTFLDFCLKPEISAKATLMPIELVGIDILIIFNDILTPLRNLGLDLDFPKGGPVISNPIRDMERVKSLPKVAFGDEPVAESLRLVSRHAPDYPVLGFCGAPFTLAVYAVEGFVKGDKEEILRLVREDPETLDLLLEKLTQVAVDYLVVQADSGGAHGVQVFESWGGMLLEGGEYERFAAKWQREVISRFRQRCPETPVHLYVRGSRNKIAKMDETGADVLSVDWDTPLAEARRGTKRTLQGNLSPEVVLDPDAVPGAFEEMIQDFDWRQGWIANLGHGITPKASVEAARRFVECVRSLAGRK